MLFDLVEEAAIRSGQTLNTFATEALEKVAREVIRRETVTVLSPRDAELFLKLINDTTAEPNAALKAAAKRYRKHFGDG